MWWPVFILCLVVLVTTVWDFSRFFRQANVKIRTPEVGTVVVTVVGVWSLGAPRYFRIEKKPGCLGYLGDNTTQLCWGLFHRPLWGSLFNNQYSGKEGCFFFVAAWLTYILPRQLTVKAPENGWLEDPFLLFLKWFHFRGHSLIFGGGRSSTKYLRLCRLISWFFQLNRGKANGSEVSSGILSLFRVKVDGPMNLSCRLVPGLWITKNLRLGALHEIVEGLVVW